jgi:hypothetical protein
MGQAPIGSSLYLDGLGAAEWTAGPNLTLARENAAAVYADGALALLGLHTRCARACQSSLIRLRPCFISLAKPAIVST